MSSSDSDSEAPETVSLKTAKQSSKEQSRREADHAKELARLKREKNQARDARIKAEKQAAASLKSKTKQKAPVVSKSSQEDEDADDEEQRRLLERMNRAMKEAEEDSDETVDEDSEEGQLHDDVEMVTDESELSEEESGSEEQDAANPDYLPDHYFTEAVTSLSAPRVSKTSSKKAEGLKRKRKHRKNKEEHVVGSRTIRTIQSATPAAARGRTAPSARTSKFLQKQLKGDAKIKGWERKSVIFSSMVSRSGPARRFVRG